MQSNEHYFDTQEIQDLHILKILNLWQLDSLILRTLDLHIFSSTDYWYLFFIFFIFPLDIEPSLILIRFLINIFFIYFHFCSGYVTFIYSPPIILEAIPLLWRSRPPTIVVELRAAFLGRELFDWCVWSEISVFILIIFIEMREYVDEYEMRFHLLNILLEKAPSQ